MVDSVSKAKQLLGRQFRGEFQALDKQGNLVLGRTSELAGASEERFIGMVLIPAAQRESVEMQATAEEQMSLMAV